MEISQFTKAILDAKENLHFSKKFIYRTLFICNTSILNSGRTVSVFSHDKLKIEDGQSLFNEIQFLILTAKNPSIQSLKASISKRSKALLDEEETTKVLNYIIWDARERFNNANRNIDGTGSLETPFITDKLSFSLLMYIIQQRFGEMNKSWQLEHHNTESLGDKKVDVFTIKPKTGATQRLHFIAASYSKDFPFKSDN